MKVTSAQAAKMLRKLNEDYQAVCLMEQQSMSFLASVGEDIESVRPEYDFAEAQAKKAVLEGRIRRLKHSINVFNVTTVVPGFDMTVDQLLVLIPQLNSDRNRLSQMKSVLPKTRELAAGFGRTSAVIDYRYANYDVEEAGKKYDEITDLLARAQTALDELNNTVTFEIDF